MITAVDTNILIDIGFGDSAAASSLESAAIQGKVIICEIVYSELCSGLPSQTVDQFLEQVGIELVFSNKEVLALAGQTWKEHLNRGGRRGRILPDFLIAAHTLYYADRLLTRDKGFYKKYFENLTVITP